MSKVIVTCRFITPLFMYGSGENVEIRASSIKGLLRYWWRTYNFFDDFEKMRVEENRIFGGKTIDYNNIIIKSPIKLKAFSQFKNQNSQSHNLESKKESIGYLLYSMLLKENQERTYLLPQHKFQIEFIYSNEKLLMEYIKALAVMQIMGGMGSRSRRGAGNFKIIEIKVEKTKDNYIFKEGYEQNDKKLQEDIEHFLKFDFTIDDLETKIKKFLKKIIRVRKNNTKFLNMQGNGFSIYTFRDRDGNIRKFESWDEALRVINSKYKKFRGKEDIRKNNFQQYHKAVFGLPIENSELEIKNNNSFIERFHSPLIFKVLETSKKTFVPIIIRLSGDILENNYELYFKKHRVTMKNKKQQDKNLIEMFLEDNEFYELYTINEERSLCQE